MAARQYLIPGGGYFDETQSGQELVPGIGYVNETSSGGGAASVTYPQLERFRPRGLTRGLAA